MPSEKILTFLVPKVVVIILFFVILFQGPNPN